MQKTNKKAISLKRLNNSQSEDIKSKKTSRNSQSSVSVRSTGAQKRAADGIHRKSSFAKSVSSGQSDHNENSSNSALSSPRVGAKKTNGIQKKSCFAQQRARQIEDNSSEDASSHSGEPTIEEDDEEMVGPMPASERLTHVKRYF